MSRTLATEHFTCPNKTCEMIYTAAREHHPDKHDGGFSCVDCATTVYTWSGNYDLVDWQPVTIKSRR